MPGQGPSRVVSLLNAIDDETLGAYLDASQSPYLSVYLTGTNTTSSGVVTIETADWNPTIETPFSSTWSPITTVNASDVSGGIQKIICLPVRAYHFVRCRVSTVIGGGGSVTAVIKAIGAS